MHARGIVFGDLSPANVFISDITPLTLDAIFALSNKLDVKIDLGFLDLQHAGDFLVLGGGINIRM